MNDPISYLTLLHAMFAGACLMLALTHLLLVVRSENRRQRWIYAFSTIMALAAGAAIVFELFKVLSLDVSSYLAALKGEIGAAYVMLLMLVSFIRLYFHSDREKLYILAVAVWTAAFVLQLLSPAAAFYTDIYGLVEYETFWGESFVKIDAAVPLWKYVSEVGSALILVYISLAAYPAWKRGNKRQALIVGGASIGFMLIAGVLVPLDDEGLVRNTMPIGFPFLMLIAALSYQLIDDWGQTSKLRLEIEQLRRASLAGEIAAGLVHEINQPLTSILSNAQAARRFLDADEPDLVEVRAAIEDVVSEDKRAAGIINGLRNLLRRRPVESKTVNMNETIRRVASMLAGDLHTSATRLHLSLSPMPANVSADEIQIQQVLLNLLLNARRALEAKPPAARTVEIRSVVLDDQVEVSVIDSGPGLDVKEAEKLFEPFTSGGDGLGMGLAICRRIVTLHSGSIRAENTDAGGAKFVFTLPLAPANTNA